MKAGDGVAMWRAAAQQPRLVADLDDDIRPVRLEGEAALLADLGAPANDDRPAAGDDARAGMKNRSGAHRQRAGVQPLQGHARPYYDAGPEIDVFGYQRRIGIEHHDAAADQRRRVRHGEKAVLPADVVEVRDQAMPRAQPGKSSPISR